jgi:hypothetical protein
VGYTREGLVSVDILDGYLPAHFQALRQELLQSGAATDAAMSSSPLTDVWNNHSGFSWEGKDPNLTPTFAAFYNTFEYGRTVHWNIVAGRDFSREYPSDSLGVVLNESAVRYMGLKDPIGAKVRFVFGRMDPVFFHVIGVVKDVVMLSPFTPVKQAIYMLDRNDNVNEVLVRINPRLSVSQGIAQMVKVFKAIDPKVPLSYMSGIVWACQFYGGTTDQGDRGTESFGRVGGSAVDAVVPGLPVAGRVVFPDCVPDCVSGDECLVAALSVCGEDLGMGVRGDDGGGIGDNVVDGVLAGGARCARESGAGVAE